MSLLQQKSRKGLQFDFADAQVCQGCETLVAWTPKYRSLSTILEGSHHDQPAFEGGIHTFEG